MECPAARSAAPQSLTVGPQALTQSETCVGLVRAQARARSQEERLETEVEQLATCTREKP